jgi:hypothetical protein
LLIRKYKGYLKEWKLIETKMQGIPAKEFIRINFYKLAEQMAMTEGQSLSNSIGLFPSNSIGHIYKDTKYKDTKYIEREPSSNKKNIIPPTIEMIKDYCKERNNQVDPNVFYDWNTSKGWVIGKSKMKDWQAAIRTWEKRDSSSNDSGNYNKQKAKYYDNIKYTLSPDGRYRSASGEVYID